LRPPFPDDNDATIVKLSQPPMDEGAFKMTVGMIADTGPATVALIVEGE